MEHLLYDQNKLKSTTGRIRFGGDEFGVIFPNKPLESVLKYVYLLSDKIKQVSVNGMNSLSISAGILDTSQTKKEKLMAEVDNLLYNSKRKGKDCISYI